MKFWYHLQSPSDKIELDYLQRSAQMFAEQC